MARGIRPSVAAALALEYGFYEGDYVVVAEPKVPFRPQMEQIRRAAETKWPGQLVAFEDIVAWTDEGAPDLLTGSCGMAEITAKRPELPAVTDLLRATKLWWLPRDTEAIQLWTNSPMS